MAQDTRKDPRAKVLTMTVRYKSATLDEFIEHHSHDISRGGMFIKTPSPFPPGTLLKFEVKIAEDQRLMQGVGRVVWKREPPEAAEDRPAGMGVKFIKIDDTSKKLIDQLVTSRGDGQSAFEAGQIPAVVVAAPPVAAAAPVAAPVVPRPSSHEPAPVAPVEAKVEAKKDQPIRKATMIGLGGIAGSAPPPAAPLPHDDAAFFPKTDPDKELPAPEDRTVMKQAAELLQDALREAGGSMEEVGMGTGAPEPKKVEKIAKDEEDISTKPAPTVEPKSVPRPEPTPERARPVEEKPIAKAREPEPERERRVEPKRAEPKRAEPAPRQHVASSALQAQAAAKPEGSGAGKAIALVLGVVAAGGLVYFVMREPPQQPPPIEPPAQPAATPQPTPTPTPTPPPPPTMEPTPPASASAAPPAEPEPSAKPEKPEKPAKPEPKAQPRPAPRPKPVVEPKPAPVPKPAPEPAEPPAEAAPKPAAPKPAPKPKPAKPSSDNPY